MSQWVHVEWSENEPNEYGSRYRDMNPVDILRSAKVLLGPNGEHWTQGTSGRAADGAPVGSLYPNAVSFCLIGAINRALGSLNDTNRDRAEAALSRLVGSVVLFNDEKDRTFPEIATLLDRAIELLDQSDPSSSR